MDYSKKINASDLFSAKGLVIVISGGGTGIGLAFTTALASSGAAKIFLLGRRLAALEAAAKQTDPSIVVPVQCDITDSASIAAAAATVAQQSPGGHVDVLINNAGVEGPNLTDLYEAGSIEELASIMTRELSPSGGTTTTMTGWDATWRTNAVAVVAVSAAFLPLLDKGNVRRGRPSGRRETNMRDDEAAAAAAAAVGEGIEPGDRRASQIITVASISAFNRHVTAGLAYTASKAGAVMLGKSLSNFLAPWGIRSNVFCPGRFPSEMMLDRRPELPVSQVPQGGSGTYEDLASLILYMVGKSGTYLNGAVEVLDGGRLSMMPATY